MMRPCGPLVARLDGRRGSFDPPPTSDPNDRFRGLVGGTPAIASTTRRPLATRTAAVLALTYGV